MNVTLSRIKFSAATPRLVATGLLGFVSATVNSSLRLDGIALRRTLDGRHVLSFPARRDNSGRSHTLFAPVSDEVRRDIEQQVFAALGLEEQPARR